MFLICSMFQSMNYNGFLFVWGGFFLCFTCPNYVSGRHFKLAYVTPWQNTIIPQKHPCVLAHKHVPSSPDIFPAPGLGKNSKNSVRQ